jgi:hypothetical protein
MQVKSLGLAVVSALAVAMPAWAHHSHANYEPTNWIELSGTVKEMDWLNPHVWVHLVVMDDKGQPHTWALEGGSPQALLRGGWKKDTVKVGDKISVKCHQLKDSSDGCLLGFLTTDGGAPKEFD